MVAKKKRVLTLVAVAVLLSAVLAYFFVNNRASKQEDAARAVIEAYFMHLVAGDVEALIDVCEPPDKDADQMIRSVRERLTDPDRNRGVEPSARSIEIIGSRKAGDLVAALISWRRDGGYRQVDLVYAKKNERGEWKMPLWVPYPPLPMSLRGPYLPVSFSLEERLGNESDKDAAEALLEWAGPEGDRLAADFFREDIIEVASKLTDERMRDGVERTPKEMIEAYFAALKLDRPAEFVSFLAWPDGDLSDLKPAELNVMWPQKLFERHSKNPYVATDQSKQGEIFAVVVCEIQREDDSDDLRQFPLAMMRQDGEWRVLQERNPFSIDPVQGRFPYSLSAEQFEEVEKLLTWGNERILANRTRINEARYAAREKALAERDARLAQLVRAGRALAEARVAAADGADEARSPSEVMEAYLKHCEKNEAAEVISLHFWHRENKASTHFTTVSLGYPLLVLPDGRGGRPEIDYSRVKVVGEQVRDNLAVVVVQRPPSTARPSEDFYFSYVYFSKQEEEWRVLVSLSSGSLSAEVLTNVHGLSPTGADHFAGLELWGRKHSSAVRKEEEQRRELEKVKESISIIAAAWEQIEKRKSSATMAATPKEAFEEFWRSYEADDLALATSYVSLELFFAEKTDLAFAEDELGKGDFSAKVRDAVGRSDGEELDLERRYIVREIEGACASRMAREVRDRNQSVIHPEVEVVWSDSVGDAGHIIVGVTRNYEKTSTTYYFPISLVKLSGEWRIITLPGTTRFGSVPKSLKDELKASWKKTDVQMEIFKD